MTKFKEYLPIVNFIILSGLVIAWVWPKPIPRLKVFKEIQAERLSIVGSDSNLYIAISSPQLQALATMGGQPISSNKSRDLPGIIFFNRIGDEVGAIFYDGDSLSNAQGITFDQQKNDQVMVLMKREYLEDEEWKRWYGMFLRERSDSITQKALFKDFYKRTKGMSESQRKAEYKKFKNYLDTEINIYRMFLGREETKNVGLFISDSKGRERIKIYVDSADHAHIQVLDNKGNPIGNNVFIEE